MNERELARSALHAGKHRWSRVIRWGSVAAVLAALVSISSILLGIVTVPSLSVGILAVAVTVLVATYAGAAIAFNLGVRGGLRDLESFFSDRTDLDLAIANLLAPLYDESNESIEQRVSRVSAAIKAVDQEVVRARALGATPTEVEVYLEMEIEDVPGFADCEPQVIGPVLDYLERLRAGAANSGE